MVDWLWTLRFINSAWEILRLRRCRALYLDGHYKSALHTIISNLKVAPGTALNVEEYNRVLKEAKAVVEQCLADPTQLAQYQLDPDLVAATAVAQLADRLEKFDRMIERAERSCDAIVQQLDLRRAVFASRARQAAARIVGNPAGEVARLAGPTIAAASTADVKSLADPTADEIATNSAALRQIASPPLAADSAQDGGDGGQTVEAETAPPSEKSAG